MYYIVAGIIDVACAVFILFDPMATPAVILIPGKEGSLGIGMSKVSESVERAIGANIL